MSATFWARTDNNNAKDPTINLRTDPAVEIEFLPQDPDGDLVLDHPGGGAVDPDTIVEIDGVEYSFIYEGNGTLPVDSKVPGEFQGDTAYLITVVDYPTPGESTRLVFLPFEDATEADMNAFGNGAIDVENVDPDPPPAPVCYLPGTMILTPDGDRPIETIGPGDLVTTALGKAAQVRWREECTVDPFTLVRDPDLEPVVIAPGALGPGVPDRPLAVSKNHCLSITGSWSQLNMGADAVLLPAKHVPQAMRLKWNGATRSVTYHNVLLDMHDVVVANKAPAESLYPGPRAVAVLDDNGQRILDGIVTRRGDYGPTCQPLLRRYEAQVLCSEMIGSQRLKRTA